MLFHVSEKLTYAVFLFFDLHLNNLFALLIVVDDVSCYAKDIELFTDTVFLSMMLFYVIEKLTYVVFLFVDLMMIYCCC